MVSFPKAISLGFSGYVNFRDRSTRAEYWWWSLFGFIASIFGVILDVSIFGLIAGNWDAADWSLFQNLIGLALFLPGLAVTVRRLHDINKSGWWCLTCVTPLIVVLIFFLCKRGDEGSNKYGIQPT